MKVYLKELWEQASNLGYIYKGKDHVYTIVNGCKIEKYTDGSVQLYNTMTGGEWYKLLTPPQVLKFAQLGFKRASIEHAVETTAEMMEAFKRRNSNKRLEEMTKLHEFYQKKLQNLNEPKY